MSRRESEGMSPAGSLSSMSASASPRESPGPMSPGPLAGKKGGGGGIQMQIQQLQGRTLAGFYLKTALLWPHRKFLYNDGLTKSLWDIPIYRCSDYHIICSYQDCIMVYITCLII